LYKDRFFSILALLFVLLLVVGCSNDSVISKPKSNPIQSTVPEHSPPSDASGQQVPPGNDSVQVQKSDQMAAYLAEWGKLPSLPTTIVEFIDYPVGQFNGIEEIKKNSEVEKHFSKLPVLPEDASASEVKQYFTYIYSLFKPDYPDPRKIAVNYDRAAPDGSDPISPELQKDTYNVEIVLDSSGSMAETIGGKTRMELAKEAISEFLASLPKEANVGLRVYGHKGTGSEKDKEMSCSANDLIYEMKPFEQSELGNALDSFKPAGWTPLTKAIELANADLSAFEGNNNRNILFIVSDGIETCGGDPVEAAEKLKLSNVKPIVNIIGFDVDNEGQKQLKAVAEAAGGTYTDVKNQDELRKQFEQNREEALKWYHWYLDSKGLAIEKRGNHYDQIMDWRSDYYDKMHTSFGAQLNAISYLVQNDKINGEQRKQMLDLYGDLRKTEMNEYEKMSDQLFELKDLQFEDAFKRIEEIFESKK
jgi:Ca-activated chloride channel homolog